MKPVLCARDVPNMLNAPIPIQLATDATFFFLQ